MLQHFTRCPVHNVHRNQQIDISVQEIDELWMEWMHKRLSNSSWTRRFYWKFLKKFSSEFRCDYTDTDNNNRSLSVHSILFVGIQLCAQWAAISPPERLSLSDLNSIDLQILYVIRRKSMKIGSSSNRLNAKYLFPPILQRMSRDEGERRLNIQFQFNRQLQARIIHITTQCCWCFLESFDASSVMEATK